ncbi:hypothetical protein RV14_GL000755 [Enterococcus ratti]|uniref:Uncharacterized protein n=1 Tax=Enterococcus ratti TaxID=150033 RepID=A0A1L8WFJ3_9ENTE|nr:hypothetical protein RV14_GL000755 [Enterococcus ratti]
MRWGIVGVSCFLILGIGLFTVNESKYSKKVEAISSEQSTNPKARIIKNRKYTKYSMGSDRIPTHGFCWICLVKAL